MPPINQDDPRLEALCRAVLDMRKRLGMKQIIIAGCYEEDPDEWYVLSIPFKSEQRSLLEHVFDIVKAWFHSDRPECHSHRRPREDSRPGERSLTDDVAGADDGGGIPDDPAKFAPIDDHMKLFPWWPRR